MEAHALHFAELKLAISPNVGDSGAQFLVVGDCVRASPVLTLKKRQQSYVFFYVDDEVVTGLF